MFGIGETELVIIVLFGFLLFGPDKLPGMGRTIGRVLRQFREASEGFTEVVQTNVIDPATKELNNTGSNKRTPAAAQKAAASVDDDDDADIDESVEAGAEQPRKRETFAERKARLEAERSAREAASAEVAQPEDPDDANSEAGGDAKAGSAKAPSEGDAPKPDAPATPSVAELYSRGSRHSSRVQADDAQEAPEAEGGEEPNA